MLCKIILIFSSLKQWMFIILCRFWDRESNSGLDSWPWIWVFSKVLVTLSTRTAVIGETDRGWRIWFHDSSILWSLAGRLRYLSLGFHHRAMLHDSWLLPKWVMQKRQTDQEEIHNIFHKIPSQITYHQSVTFYWLHKST